jgi:hypothetical protein
MVQHMHIIEHNGGHKQNQGQKSHEHLSRCRKCHWQNTTFFYSKCFLLLLLFVCYCSFIHMCMHCLSHFSTLPPSPPQFQAGPVLPLWLILLKKRHKHNKKDKAFLLVELRLAIQKDSYYCSHVNKSFKEGRNKKITSDT